MPGYDLGRAPPEALTKRLRVSLLISKLVVRAQ
jgi:hypothetical protein